MVSYDYTYFTFTRCRTLCICLSRRLVGHWINSYCIAKIYRYVTDSCMLRMQPEIHRQSVDRVLGFLSSRPNRDSPTPSPAGECVLPSFGSGGGIHTHCGRGGWGVPIPTREQTLWYSRYLPIHALCVHRHGVGTLYTDNMRICTVCVRSSGRLQIFAHFVRRQVTELM